MTPPEVWADRDPGTEPDRPGWHVRVVPNKFPAFAGPLTAADTERGALPVGADGRGARGGHPQPRPPGHPGRPGGAGGGAGDARPGGERLAAHRDEALGAVLIIVNQGRTAGASLEHPHSQVFATAGRPDRVQAELDRLAGGDCAACATVAAERDGPRLVGADRGPAHHLPVGVGGPVRGPAAARGPPAPLRGRRRRRRHRRGHRPARPAPALPRGRRRPRPLQPGPALGPAGGRRLPLAPAPAPPPHHLRRVRAGHRGGHQRRRPRPGRRGAAAASGS